MAASIGEIVVDPQGESVDVSITTNGTSALVCYTTRDGNTAHTFPQTISSRTVYYVRRPTPAHVSCTRNGVELSATGSPRVVYVDNGVSASVTPLGGGELEQFVLALAAGSSSSSSPLLATVSYAPGSETTATSTSTTAADIDATNLAVTFTAPASGAVLVRLSAGAYVNGSTTYMGWNLRDSGGDVANTKQRVLGGQGAISNDQHRPHYVLKVTGLTPGNSYTWKWGHYREAGTATANTNYGGPLGQAVMEVWAA